MIKICILII